MLQVSMLAISGRWKDWWTPGRVAILASAGHGA
jgi:hypothetical protein